MAFATCVLNHIFADVHTSKVYYSFWYFLKIPQCVFRCISAFVFLCLGLCLDRPILHFAGLALSVSIRFAAPQTVMLLKGSLRPCLEYFIITLVVVVVGFAGVTIRKLSFA